MDTITIQKYMINKANALRLIELIEQKNQNRFERSVANSKGDRMRRLSVDSWIGLRGIQVL
jgi:hypothetical protein